MSALFLSAAFSKVTTNGMREKFEFYGQFFQIKNGEVIKIISL